MEEKKKTYESPRLAERGAVVTRTEGAFTKDLEADMPPMRP
jgi:hypothetical protein